MNLLARLFVPIALIVFAVAFYIQAGEIRSLYDTGPIGAADFPKLLAVGLVVSVIVAVGLDFRKAGKEERAEPVDWGGVGAALLVVAVCAVYVALFRVAGYFIATTAFGLALLAIFSRLKLNWLVALVEAVVLMAVVYGLFAGLLDVRLPAYPALDFLFGAGPAPEVSQ